MNIDRYIQILFRHFGEKERVGDRGGHGWSIAAYEYATACETSVAHNLNETMNEDFLSPPWYIGYLDTVPYIHCMGEPITWAQKETREKQDWRLGCI